MSSLSRAQAGKLLKERIAEIEQLKQLDPEDPKFKAWKNSTLKLLKNILGESDEFVHNFEGIPYSPLVFSGSMSDSDLQEWYAEGLEQAKAVLEKLLQYLEQLPEDYFGDIVPSDNRYFKLVEPITLNKFVFVLMPFSDERVPRQIFDSGIKGIVKEYGLDCIRVDDDTRSLPVHNKIYTYTIKSEFVIADLTSYNPNVLYELGIAHALNKPAILIAQKGESLGNLPFDVRHIHVLPYDRDDLSELKSILRRTIGDILEVKVKE